MTELAVFSTIGARSAAEALFQEFERNSGHRLVVTWASAAMLVKRIAAGETADVVILSRAGLDAVKAAGKIVPGSDAPLASSGVAIAVKAGGAKPDISTAEALKRTLLACKSIAYSEPSAGGASGVHFAKLIEQMGIAEAMKSKTRYPPPGGFSGELLLTGEAELAVQQKPELLHVAGTEIVGMLPDAINMVTEFVAGIMVGSANVETANSLIAMLRSPESAAVFRSKGLDPS